MEKKYKILFVCLGNICRSPAAEGILQKLLQKAKLSENIEVDSAGTYGGHAGELPDSRMRAHAARRGYKLTHRSRQIKWDDFEKFDLILGMDDTNISKISPRSGIACKNTENYRFLQKITIRSYPRPLLFGKRRV